MRRVAIAMWCDDNQRTTPEPNRLRIDCESTANRPNPLHHQFIDLFLSGRVEDIAEKSIREEKYSHLSPVTMLKILDKYKEVGLFASVPKHIPNVKRKNVDIALKALKALTKH